MRSKFRLYFIDDNGGGFSWLSGLFTIGEIYITSVAGLVDKALAEETKKGKKIDEMFIIGHGAPGWQGVGAGKGETADPNGEKSLEVDDATGKLKGAAETQLNRLKGHFAPGAVVTLGGCEVAKGTEGQKLLRAVSKALGGVPVQGGDVAQHSISPGSEGNVIRCNDATCWVQSAAWW
jgi:hypothetical protein